MTLDGFLPDEESLLMKWVKTNKKGFPYWRKHSSFDLPVGYPMLDLISKRNSLETTFIYLAEITDRKKVELLNALELYNIIDEWIVYCLPEIKGNGCYLLDKFAANFWKLKSTVRYKNNICRMIYHKKETSYGK